MGLEVFHGAIAPLVLWWGAAGLDYALGDPWQWLHPVQVMGWFITRYTHWVKPWSSALARRWAGVALALGMILGSGAIAAGLMALGAWIHPALGGAIAVVELASCFAGRSLRDAAVDVLRPLQAGDLAEARSRLSRYVGRDTAHLDEPEILRAVLETVAENAVDGVTAPLFYALVGGLVHPLGAVAMAMGYKAASTLDSMVGYRTPPYRELGWCSARLEDGLTWLPCRLTVLSLALMSGRPLAVWRICRRDAIADPSPNSGWSEGVYAAVLGVRLGGENTYRGVVTVKPYLGDPLRPITPAIIHAALRLTRWCCLGWLAIATGFLLLGPFWATLR